MFDAMLNWLKRDKKTSKFAGKGAGMRVITKKKGKGKPNPRAIVKGRMKKLGQKGAFGKCRPIPTEVIRVPERNFSKSPDREWLADKRKKWLLKTCGLNRAAA